MSTPYRRKLIEVALPLEAINTAAAREKSIRHGHPSTLHLWWARRPLAAARAVLFSQLVDDPSSWPELFPTDVVQNQERQRLFRLIEELVQWENSNNATVINAARLEIARSHARGASSLKAKAVLSETVTPAVVNTYLATELPPVHDPFAGGGTIPLEAQRLGLRAIATDLNPVAVMISKALIEIPPRWANRAPVNPASHPNASSVWRSAEGLADDVRYYGSWMRTEAQRRVGMYYPDVDVDTNVDSERRDLAGLHGTKLTAIAWIWARTVPSPNPAFAGAPVPLISNFWLSTKPGKEAWLEPIVEGRTYRFRVCTGKPPANAIAVETGTKLGRGANFRCILSGTPIEPEYIKAQGLEGRMSERLLAVVAEGPKGRVYLSPCPSMEDVASQPQVSWAPEEEFVKNSRHMTPWAYGLGSFAKLFTRRQLATVNAFSDLVLEARERVRKDASTAGLGTEADEYADDISVYLACCVSKLTSFLNSLARWRAGEGKSAPAFGRQALPMVWDFVEINPFAGAGGDFDGIVDGTARVITGLPAATQGQAVQWNATRVSTDFESTILSTDPPYFDNVPYADLADYFYVWLRHALGGKVLPQLFQTVLTPKADELIADSFRHGGWDAAQAFFLQGMRTFALAAAVRVVPGLPATFYYAFKQSEDDDHGNAAVDAVRSSTGWERFLEALLEASLSIEGTWPVRTEGTTRLRGQGSNALASSIVLVCRNRPTDAPTTTRGDFRRLLRKELPDALKKLQQGNIAPVDVAQASIGPGMAIFSRHKQVSEADGTAMSVRSALQLINEVLDEYLASGEGDFDPDTRFAITWYEQHGWEAGLFGEANTLATARNVSVDGVVAAGICHSAGGKVRILKRPEMRPLEYDPATDDRPTIWEFTQHMIRLLEVEGEESAARLLKNLGSASDATRELAYRLYNTCERKKWSEDARSYNGLILAWPELEKLAAKIRDDEPPALVSLSGSDEKAAKKGRRKTKAQKKGQQNLFAGDDK